MPGSTVVVYLPYATTVVVQAFVNAANQQAFTITPPTGSPITFQGTGYYDTQVGQTTITTPPSGPGPDGAAYQVAISHSSDGGQTWQPSQVDAQPCQIVYYNLYVVASEDAGDNTWDDATLYFSWTAVPPQAPAADFESSTYAGRA